MGVVTRFAPSPTGYLHLGHAFSALLAHDRARAAGGRFLLRIEDIDQARARPDFAAAIEEDLAWLGLTWDGPVRVQSRALDDYRAALATLERQGVVYPCFCSRRDIAAEIGASLAAPQGPEGPLYPGTCRSLDPDLRARRLAEGLPHVLRLDGGQALRRVAGPLVFQEEGAGPRGEHGSITATPEALGDVVLARRDAPASYHLCVVVDDALQGVTHVTRGEDLFAAASLQRLLQALLGLPTPVYVHHRLIRDAAGQRLAKRADAEALRALRAQGVSPAAIRSRVGV